MPSRQKDDKICEYHIDIEKRLSSLDGKVSALIIINLASLAMALLVGCIAKVG